MSRNSLAGDSGEIRSRRWRGISGALAALSLVSAVALVARRRRACAPNNLVDIQELLQPSDEPMTVRRRGVAPKRTGVWSASHADYLDQAPDITCARTGDDKYRPRRRQLSQDEPL